MRNRSRPHGRTVWIPCSRRGEPTPGAPHRWHYREVFAASLHGQAWDWWCGHCGHWYSEVTAVPNNLSRPSVKISP